MAGDEGCGEGEDGGAGGGDAAVAGGWGVLGMFVGLGVMGALGGVVGVSELGEPGGEECCCCCCWAGFLGGVWSDVGEVGFLVYEWFFGLAGAVGAVVVWVWVCDSLVE